jgi:hypothetical protein
VGTFTDPLYLKYLDGTDWEVDRTFTYVTDDGRTILVPAGFVTDFASIPRFFWRLLPPTGRYGKAAVIHDFLYRTPTAPFTRAEADQVFADAMADLGVRAATRRAMWAAVRTFGGGAYQPRFPLAA